MNLGTINKPIKPICARLPANACIIISNLWMPKWGFVTYAYRPGALSACNSMATAIPGWRISSRRRASISPWRISSQSFGQFAITPDQTLASQPVCIRQNLITCQPLPLLLEKQILVKKCKDLFNKILGLFPDCAGKRRFACWRTSIM
jgi:hypothetical protein